MDVQFLGDHRLPNNISLVMDKEKYLSYDTNKSMYIDAIFWLLFYKNVPLLNYIKAYVGLREYLW